MTLIQLYVADVAFAVFTVAYRFIANKTKVNFVFYGFLAVNRKDIYWLPPWFLLLQSDKYQNADMFPWNTKSTSDTLKTKQLKMLGYQNV